VCLVRENHGGGACGVGGGEGAKKNERMEKGTVYREDREDEEVERRDRFKSRIKNKKNNWSL
jgi:hypothetical protein